MADNSSGLPVLTIGAGSNATTQYVGVKIFDSAGTNQVAVNANNALKSDLSNYGGTATGAGNAIHVQPGTAATFTVNAPVGTPAFVRLSDGAAALIGQATMAASLPVVIASNQSTIVVDTELTAVAALADATANPTITNIAGYLMGFNGTTWDRVRTANTGRLQVDVITGGGSNAAILVDNAGFTDGTSSVSTSGYIFDEVAGIALTENDVAAARIDSKRSQVLVLEDATTRGQRQAVTAAGAASANIAQINGATSSATNPLFVELSTGAGAYTLFGQTNATAPFSRITDGTTNVAVIAGTTALKTDLSSVAGTATVTGGLAGSVGIGGLAASGATISGNPVLLGGTFTTAQPTVTTGQAVNLQTTNRGALIIATGADTPAFNLTTYGGTATTLGQKAMTASMPVTLASDQSSLSVTLAANQSVNLAQVAGTTTVTGGLAGSQGVGGLAASGAAKSGNPVQGGAVFTTAQPTVTTGQVVEFQATARGGLIIATGADTPAFNLTQVGGSTISATVPVASRLTDGTAFYANTGQTAGTSVFSRINDGTTTAGVIISTTALKVDIASRQGAVDSATNPLSVRLTDGAAFYSSGSGAPTAATFSTQTSAALGAGASVTLTHYVTNTKTGQLMGADVAGSVPLKVEIGTILTGAFTARTVAFAAPYAGLQWRSPYKTFITRASADATTGFGVRITNKDASVAADVYSTGYWDEV